MLQVRLVRLRVQQAQRVPHLLSLDRQGQLAQLVPPEILDLLGPLVRLLVRPAQLALLEKQGRLGQHQRLQGQQALRVMLVLSQVQLALQAQHPRLLVLLVLLVLTVLRVPRVRLVLLALLVPLVVRVPLVRRVLTVQPVLPGQQVPLVQPVQQVLQVRQVRQAPQALPVRQVQPEQQALPVRQVQRERPDQPGQQELTHQSSLAQSCWGECESCCLHYRQK